MVSRLKWFFPVAVVGLMLAAPGVQAGYGAKICKDAGNKCVTVKKGDTWEKLFPNSSERELVRRLNRMNINPRKGDVIAVPENLSSLGLMDIAPFPRRIARSENTTVVVDQSKLAWGAYSSEGQLIKWGPMSGGKGFCSDIKEKCVTPSGEFRVFRKEGSDCKSSTFPVNEGGGAPMPYCTFFSNGVAFHGSEEVPGYNASHGCVRMFIEDAEWLNENFVEMGLTRVLVDNNLPKGLPGTAVPNSKFIGTPFRKGSLDEFAWH